MHNSTSLKGFELLGTHCNEVYTRHNKCYMVLYHFTHLYGLWIPCICVRRFRDSEYALNAIQLHCEASHCVTAAQRVAGLRLLLACLSAWGADSYPLSDDDFLSRAMRWAMAEETAGKAPAVRCGTELNPKEVHVKSLLIKFIRVCSISTLMQMPLEFDGWQAE